MQCKDCFSVACRKDKLANWKNPKQQTEWKNALAACWTNQIVGLSEAIARLPVYQHALSCESNFENKPCTCGTEEANTIRFHARKVALLED